MGYSRIDDGRTVTARKKHCCEWCGQPILKGDKCRRRKYVYNGEFVDRRMHVECFAALNRHAAHSWDSEFYPEENVRGVAPHEEA